MMNLVEVLAKQRVKEGLCVICGKEPFKVTAKCEEDTFTFCFTCWELLREELRRRGVSDDDFKDIKLLQ